MMQLMKILALLNNYFISRLCPILINND